MVDNTVDNKVDEGKPNGWKQRLSDLLKELGFSDDNFKGKVIININQGDVRNIEQVKFHN